mmetsp:Transcript_27851/g.79784  ORF Transcript_27851/g.79784 Transcript_27851/m.79784 type:complete len:289 (+) Transcript_27851:389-1255(+)
MRELGTDKCLRGRTRHALGAAVPALSTLRLEQRVLERVESVFDWEAACRHRHDPENPGLERVLAGLIVEELELVNAPLPLELDRADQAPKVRRPLGGPQVHFVVQSLVHVGLQGANRPDDMLAEAIAVALDPQQAVVGVFQNELRALLGASLVLNKLDARHLDLCAEVHAQPGGSWDATTALGAPERLRVPIEGVHHDVLRVGRARRDRAPEGSMSLLTQALHVKLHLAHPPATCGAGFTDQPPLGGSRVVLHTDVVDARGLRVGGAVAEIEDAVAAVGVQPALPPLE